MICQKCKEQGLKSRVIIPNQLRIMPRGGPQQFYDENNVYHYHDPDIREDEWRCTNGHRWTRILLVSCLVDGCDWNNRPDIGETIKWIEEKPEEKVPESVNTLDA